MEDTDRAGVSAEIQKLKQQLQRLQRRVERLANENEHLEWRVERIESSIVFRTLRGVGQIVNVLRSKMAGALNFQHSPQCASDRAYVDWTRDMALLRSPGISNSS